MTAIKVDQILGLNLINLIFLSYYNLITKVKKEKKIAIRLRTCLCRRSKFRQTNRRFP